MPDKPQWTTAEQENLACEAIADEVALTSQSVTTPQADGVRLAAETIAARIRARRQERA